MIKRILSIACLLALVVSTTAAYAFSREDGSKHTEISLDKVSTASADEVTVLTLSPSDIHKIENDFTRTQLVAYLGTNGLIVYKDYAGLDASNLDAYFNLMTREVAASKKNVKSDTQSAGGKDIAIIYYLDKGDVISTHTINVDDDGTPNIEYNDSLIEETIDNIIDKKDQPVENVSLRAGDVTGQYIGERGYTYTRPPKGKLDVDYEFYTAQNVNSKDYYIVFCDVNGIPGAALYEDYPSYQEKYQGEEMVVNLIPVTTSVELDDYGPDRTITSSAITYGVDVGVSGKDLAISRSTSYTRNILDTEIATKCNTTDAKWELTLYDPAQSDNCKFEPAATFECSSSKTSIDLNCFVSYTLDSTFTAQEEISLDRTVTCTETSVLGGE